MTIDTIINAQRQTTTFTSLSEAEAWLDWVEQVGGEVLSVSFLGEREKA